MRTICTRYFFSIPLAVILIFLLFPCLEAFAQEAPMLELTIKLTLEKGKFENAVITITKDGAPYRVIDPNKSKYNMNLELGSTFLFVFSKVGYITKSVIFDLHIPPGREKEYFAQFLAEINLAPQPEDNIITYSQPVGMVKYSNSNGDFDFDKDYSATASEQQKKDEKNSVPREKAPPPPKPEVVKPKATASIAPSKPIPVAIKKADYVPTPEKPKVVPQEPYIPPKPVVKNKEERIVQRDRLKITTVNVVIDGIDYNYRMEEYSWGGTYFYKGERNITESTYRRETD